MPDDESNESAYALDLLGRKKFAEDLEKFIEIDREYVDNSLAIAINAQFGEGKSTFLRMWSDDMKKRGNYIPVMLNAWESDLFGDPLFAIISSLVEQMPKDKAVPQGIKSVTWMALSVANQYVKKKPTST